MLRPPPFGRRAFLGGAAATAASLAFRRRARAESVAAADRRFLFVYTMGGWDVTRVFAPLFGAADVAMEADGALATAGGIPYVDHPGRPAVRAFFDAHHSRVAVLNGLYISSISHSSATRMITTGTPDASVADWPSRLAAARSNAHVIPHLVIGGPNFTGPHGVNVGHAGASGQLQGIATGAIRTHDDAAIPSPLATDVDRVDAWLAAATPRASAAYGGASKAGYTTYGVALEKARALKGLADDVDLDGGTTFSEQVALATRVLSLGLSRCAAVTHPRVTTNTAWDTHTGNDPSQSALFEDLFAELTALVALLEATPGAQAATLADETVVVVLSEMGRTPYVNTTAGKDHWPYTSALLFGPGVAGGRVVGGFDEGLYGQPIDLASGLPDEGGSTVGPNGLGATLMVLGDVDPEAEGLVDRPVTALLA